MNAMIISGLIGFVLGFVAGPLVVWGLLLREDRAAVRNGLMGKRRARR
jgi:hypothetical protein